MKLGLDTTISSYMSQKDRMILLPCQSKELPGHASAFLLSSVHIAQLQRNMGNVVFNIPTFGALEGNPKQIGLTLKKQLCCVIYSRELLSRSSLSFLRSSIHISCKLTALLLHALHKERLDQNRCHLKVLFSSNTITKQWMFGVHIIGLVFFLQLVSIATKGLRFSDYISHVYKNTGGVERTDEKDL